MLDKFGIEVNCVAILTHKTLEMTLFVKRNRTKITDLGRFVISNLANLYDNLL